MEVVYKSLEHAPALLAMIIIVIAFLHFLKHLLESHAKRTDEFIAAVRDINQLNQEARTESRTIIKENTMAAAHNTIAMSEMTAAIRSVGLKKK